ncbi:ANTAR domain-containing protein [Desertihabitans brevis]|uniref:ANTAR domain-containing protein n=1 Tax=Desertihabitans brevis TaxID=2268447 RepID=A0A367YXY8_9ACTN|nr:GAF and ANTAR domain-containing protein [Desertihabitans brevis]RCK70700.1 ANTAR domain-containing protein [Desertihabitans brevis]
MSSDFVRQLGRQPDEPATLDAAVHLVTELVPGVDHAGVTMVVRTGLSTHAATSDVVRRGDALQYDLGEGPCLDALRVEHTVVSNDLTTERRWPRWAPAAVQELGVRAMLSVLLYTDEATHSLGALNLYSSTTDVYDRETLLSVEELAAQVAVVVQTDRELHHHKLALANRTVIGQAQGIVMERLDVDADIAFSYLRRVSQSSNRKLSAVAHEIVTTRRLPALDGSDGG